MKFPDSAYFGSTENCVRSADGENDHQENVKSGNWHVSIRFDPHILKHGMDPFALLRELEKAGEIVNVTVVEDHFPVWQEMDPKLCYLGLEIDLGSLECKEDIEEVFAAAWEFCEIHILPPHCYVSDYIRVIQQLPEQNLRLGEILIQSGALTQRELDQILKIQKFQSDISDTPLRRFGDIALQQGIIDSSVVQAALHMQENVRQRHIEESQVVRISAAKLEKLINTLGELLICGANHKLLSRQVASGPLMDASENLLILAQQIRETALNMRMVPIGIPFGRFHRIVSQLSRDLGNMKRNFETTAGKLCAAEKEYRSGASDSPVQARLWLDGMRLECTTAEERRNFHAVNGGSRKELEAAAGEVAFF
ncbi:MAG: hypothetical protein L0Y43_04635 [Methylococcaceae bacterium]|nr:hypothetical protein [Methylococcaceae bacterium]